MEHFTQIDDEFNSSDELTYVKPEDLSEADIEWNVQRLRTEANLAIEHADAFEEWSRK